jgi:hypothetical protein
MQVCMRWIVKSVFGVGAVFLAKPAHPVLAPR